MDDTEYRLTATVASVLACLSLACFIPDCSGDDGGGPTGNCEDAPATNPAEANRGDLDARLGRANFSPGTEPRARDVYADSGDAGATGPETYSGYVFVPLADEDPSMEIHTGPQGGGGIHLEPAVVVRDDISTLTETVVNFQVRDPSSGDVLTHTACEKGELRQWEDGSNGRMFHGMRVIFDVDRSRAQGRREIIADVQVGERRKIIERIVQVE